jgi:hypothetical protein
MSKRILVSVFLILVVAAAGWAVFRFTAARRNRPQPTNESNLVNSPNPNAWAEAVEKVKADRGGEGAGALEIPPELKHYSDRHWFLATQVAEIAKYNVHTCQDYLDLAATIERGDIVAVPAVTDTYVLFGVGAKADEGVFTRYEDDRDIELYNEAQLNEAYRRLEEKRSNLMSQIATMEKALRSRPASRQKDRSQVSAQQSLEQELKSTEEEKALLDEFYGQPVSRQRLFRDYESLQTLAHDFGGRSYNLDLASDRQALKVNMLSALRPQALKVLEAVASAYHSQFNRPLPVSSLVRPEQYQHALHRVNRNAVLIESPPHSTGLSFDIDYRYMSAAEQTFLMGELAGLKREGRIEVIRERNANYHVFAFVNGTRPSDDLITASLEEASTDLQEAHHPPAKAAKIKAKSQKGRVTKARTSRSKTREGRKRRH